MHNNNSNNNNNSDNMNTDGNRDRHLFLGGNLSASELNTDGIYLRRMSFSKHLLLHLK